MEPLAEAQWVHMVIQNKMATGDISVKNANLKWGKFYEWDDKSKEISAATVNSQVATREHDADVAASGRANASSGTEGSLDLYNGNTKITTFSWDCPWGSKTNTFKNSSVNNSYVVQHSGANLYSGAIGTVTIKVARLD